MACTVDAARCAELIARYRGNKTSKEPSFTTQFNAVFHLLGRLRLSRHNVILCGKFINEMADTWNDKEQLEMIDQLRARQQRSWKRWETRIAEKAAAKAAGAGRRGRKQTTAPTRAPAPIADFDPWGMMDITEGEKEKLIGFEIMRLMQLTRDESGENLLDAAIAGREKNVESVTKLWNFVLQNFGDDLSGKTPSRVTGKFWEACSGFLKAAGLTDMELEKLRHPFPSPGEPGFESILDEMHERQS
jgi:hypothetical protein